MNHAATPTPSSHPAAPTARPSTQGTPVWLRGIQETTAALADPSTPTQPPTPTPNPTTKRAARDLGRAHAEAAWMRYDDEPRPDAIPYPDSVLLPLDHPLASDCHLAIQGRWKELLHQQARREKTERRCAREMRRQELNQERSRFPWPALYYKKRRDPSRYRRRKPPAPPRPGSIPQAPAQMHTVEMEGAPAHRLRAKSFRAKRLTRWEMQEAQRIRKRLPVVQHPKTRADCADMPRPCPMVSCSMNLYLEVNPENGSIKVNFPNREPWEMPPEASCAHDVAERGGITLEELGRCMNVTLERGRQLEWDAVDELRCKLGVETEVSNRDLAAGLAAIAAAPHAEPQHVETDTDEEDDQ